MKKIIPALIFITIILWACGGGDTTTTLPPTAPPDIEPPNNPHIIAIYDPITPEIGTSDGEYYFPLAHEQAANARDGFLVIGDILHDIDISGVSRSTQRLPVAPDAITISGYIWSFKIIGNTHTKIFRGSNEYGNYLDNPWLVADAIATAGGDIIATDDRNRYHSAAEPNLIIRYAAHNGIMIHSIDVTNRRAYIRGVDYDTHVAFSTNYLFGADQWIEADGVWYSWNGYTWDGSVLTELETVMKDFVLDWYSENPVLIAAGSRLEHGEHVIYWIECNTGLLYRYTPSIDRLEEIISLYAGTGLRGDGVDLKTEIKPVMAGGYLFYSWGGTVWKYNFNDALVSSFAAGVEIWRM